MNPSTSEYVKSLAASTTVFPYVQTFMERPGLHPAIRSLLALDNVYRSGRPALWLKKVKSPITQGMDTIRNALLFSPRVKYPTPMAAKRHDLRTLRKAIPHLYHTRIPRIPQKERMEKVAHVKELHAKKFARFPLIGEQWEYRDGVHIETKHREMLDDYYDIVYLPTYRTVPYSQDLYAALKEMAATFFESGGSAEHQQLKQKVCNPGGKNFHYLKRTLWEPLFHFYAEPEAMKDVFPIPNAAEFVFLHGVWLVREWYEYGVEIPDIMNSRPTFLHNAPSILCGDKSVLEPDYLHLSVLNDGIGVCPTPITSSYFMNRSGMRSVYPSEVTFRSSALCYNAEVVCESAASIHNTFWSTYYNDYTSKVRSRVLSRLLSRYDLFFVADYVSLYDDEDTYRFDWRSGMIGLVEDLALIGNSGCRNFHAIPASVFPLSDFGVRSLQNNGHKYVLHPAESVLHRAKRFLQTVQHDPVRWGLSDRLRFVFSQTVLPVKVAPAMVRRMYKAMFRRNAPHYPNWQHIIPVMPDDDIQDKESDAAYNSPYFSYFVERMLVPAECPQLGQPRRTHVVPLGTPDPARVDADNDPSNPFVSLEVMEARLLRK